MDTQTESKLEIKAEFVPLTKPKKDNPLGKLLAMQKKAIRRIICDKKGVYMISFPMYWLKQWNSSRYIIIEPKSEDTIFIHLCKNKEMATDKLLKVGDTHYIKLKSEIIELLNYPQTLKMEFFHAYLIITIPDAEKSRIHENHIEIKRKKINKQMENHYSRTM